MISQDVLIENLSSCLERMEKLRLRLSRRRRNFKVIAGAIIVGAVLFTLLLFPFFLFGSFFLCAFIAFASIIILKFIMLSKMEQRYVSEYKEKVVSEALQHVDQNLHYSPKAGITEEEFKMSDLQKKYHKFYSEDVIQGRYAQTLVKFGEVHTQKRDQGLDAEEGDYLPVFKGIYFMADFHKNFSGVTYVVPDRAEKMLSGMGRKLQQLLSKRGTKLIQMDDPEFEREFAIYSTDDVECRYLLSNALMRRILEMKSRLQCNDVKLTFKNSALYVSISYDKLNYLEPNLATPATDTQQLRLFTHQLIAFLSIVDELSLNTRIWSKV